jgi:AraC-like DNA-binding protein
MKHFTEKIIALLVLFICPILLCSQNDRIISIDAIHLIDSFDLLPYTQIWIDSSQKTSFQNIELQNFQTTDLNKLSKPLKWTNLWLKIKMQNISDTATLKGGFYAEAKGFDCYTSCNKSIHYNGENTPYSKSIFKENPYFQPIELHSKTAETYYLRIQFDRQESHVMLLWKSPSKEIINRNDKFQHTKGVIIWQVVFIAIWLVVALYAFGQWQLHEHRAYLWYGICLIFNILYYLRHTEMDINIPILFSYTGYREHFEGFLLYGMFLSYLPFYSQFLELQKEAPLLPKISRILQYTFVGFILLDIILYFSFGFKVSFALLNYTRPILFLVVFNFLYFFFRQNQRLEVRLLGIGTSLLLFSTFFTAMGDLIKWDYTFYWQETIRVFKTHWFNIPIFSVRIGVMLEVIFFSTALYLKTKREKQEKKDNETRLNMLVEEAESLKAQLFNTRSVPIEILNDHKKETNEDLIKATKIVDEHFADSQFNAEQFAQLMHMSYSTLNRHLNDLAQTSPADFIRTRRLNHAAQLLRGSKMSINQIVDACGFENYSSFFKSFSNHFGQSPTAYRQNTSI